MIEKKIGEPLLSGRGSMRQSQAGASTNWEELPNDALEEQL